jgi:hypothetical protein
MYGIYGIFRFSERLSGADLEWLSVAQNALRHRGQMVIGVSIC